LESSVSEEFEFLEQKQINRVSDLTKSRDKYETNRFHRLINDTGNSTEDKLDKPHVSKDFFDISRSLISPHQVSISDSDLSFLSDYKEFDSKYAFMLVEKFQSMDEFKDWEIKLDEDNVKIWFAKDTSEA
jgi:hypothetical protein